MFGPAQAAVARGVVDAVRDGIIPADQVDDLCIIVGVFIHWEATDDKKIFDWNCQATKESIARAMGGEPTAQQVADGGPRRATRSPAEPRGSRTQDRTVQPGARRLDGARAVVTGASSGIGARDRRGVRRRRRDGAHHVPRAARRPRARSPTASRRAAAARSSRAPTSATRAAASGSSPRRASALGGLDVWVNNAGADVLTGDAADWDWERKLDLLLAVDLKGTIACSYAAGAVMREQPGGGTIVNMSWDHVHDGMAGENPELFSAVKGGVLAYSKSLARALAPAVRVNVLCPGWIETALRRARPTATSAARSRRTPLGAGARPRTSPTRRVWLASPGGRRSSPGRRSTSTAAL